MSEPILLLLSGPNLNLLGEREPETYGSETLEEHVQAAKNKAAEIGFLLEHFFNICDDMASFGPDKIPKMGQEPRPKPSSIPDRRAHGSQETA